LINDYKSLSFNYNRRIERPSYSDLNPFRLYTTSFNYSEGNPFLAPSITNNFELSYNYKNSYSSFYVNYLENGFDQVTYVEPNSIIQRVIPNNFFNQINYGLFQSYSFTIKDIWENNSDISVFYFKTNSSIENVVPSISAWSGSLNTQNTIIIDKDKNYKVELGFMYQLPSLAGSYKLSSFYQVNLGFKANFVKNKLQLSVNAIDIFKTNKQIFTQFVNNIKQENYDYADIRRIRVSLTYNFGGKLSIEKKENGNTEEKDRIK
jgi:TonB dependent receptor.